MNPTEVFPNRISIVNQLELAEIQKLIKFEEDLLFNHEVEPSNLFGTQDTEGSLLEQLNNFSVESSTLHLSFFLTNEGISALKTLFLPYFTSNADLQEYLLRNNINFSLQDFNLEDLKITSLKARSRIAEKLNIVVTHFTDNTDIERYFASLDWNKIDTKNLVKIFNPIVKASTEYFDNEMGMLILKYTKEPDPQKSILKNKAKNQKKVRLVHEPLKLLEYTQTLRMLKGYYKKRKKELEEGKDSQNNNLWLAKFTIIEYHIRNINYQISRTYPSLIGIIQEHYSNIRIEDENPTERKKEISLAANNLLSRGTKINRHSNKSSKDYFLRILKLANRGSSRLDNYLFGGEEKGDLRSGISFSPITDDLEKFAEQVGNKENQRNKSIDADFLERIEEILGKTFNTQHDFFSFIENYLIDIKTFREIGLKILEKLGLKSEEEYDPSTKKAPADNKLRINPDSKSSSLSVSHLTIHAPQTYQKTFIEFITIFGHELMHGIQAINKRRNTIPIDEQGQGLNLIALNALRIPQSVTTAEGGALQLQREILQMLTGTQRQSSLAYLKAIKVRLEGGNYLESALAFFDQFVEERGIDRQDNDKLRDAAKRAASRVRRTYRNELNYDSTSGLISSSKDLNYLEAALLSQVESSGDLDLNTMFSLSGSNPFFFSVFNKLGLINKEKFITVPDEYNSLAELVIITAFEAIRENIS